ncbi:hypothetical protein CONLIGDRAFT_646487 [Coniochaeta ligniaria NRRL 30616]|uniref:Uncharacterized protein n=1 Tax=Coniochaeta ligniaria NRRL 30616 TaxID=1408157 RepID=A0A1J7IFS0_9PEZI|nr:hypothetical protein CONLIGDRAFT_646487 [Coniochaeta ligniaria NRRL 30616]
MNARRADWLVMRGADETAASRLSQLNLRRVGDSVEAGDSSTAAVGGGGGAGAEADDHLTPEEVAVVEHFGLPREQAGTPREQAGTPLFEIALGYAPLVIDGIVNAEPAGFRAGDDDGDDGGFDEGDFKEKFEAAMAGGILPRWQLMLSEQELLSGMDPQDIRSIFRGMLKLDDEEDESLPNRVPVGVEAGLCLMVDDGVVDSLLDEREGRRPYITGVLSDIDDDEVPDEAVAVHFKIALDSVVDLWRQVQVQDIDVLMPPEGKMYVSPGVFEDADEADESPLSPFSPFNSEDGVL